MLLFRPGGLFQSPYETVAPALRLKEPDKKDSRSARAALIAPLSWKLEAPYGYSPAGRNCSASLLTRHRHYALDPLEPHSRDPSTLGPAPLFGGVCQ